MTAPETPHPDDRPADDEEPAFDVDLEPEDQGSAEAADEQTA